MQLDVSSQLQWSCWYLDLPSHYKQVDNCINSIKLSDKENQQYRLVIMKRGKRR